MSDPLRVAALDYHRRPEAGKLALVATKPLADRRDRALAYSPALLLPPSRSRRTQRKPPRPVRW
jgi:malate dehydrogenase (oxaloacetate-decarboxylating)(NADP+)